VLPPGPSDLPAGTDPDDPWLVVGLGNPGASYAKNRHNIGAMVLDVLADRERARLSAHRAHADVAELRLAPVGGNPGHRVVLAKPRTYMNVSGGPVAALLRYFRLPPERLLVVHDELDLPFATLRLKRDGGEGGHNGLRSVSQSLATRDYCRLRVGIGRPPGRMDAADFVLKDFSATERRDLDLLLVEAADAVALVLQEGWERAQNTINAQSG
jgi:PTH1 family peptidyl-tRNA hydrolase